MVDKAFFTSQVRAVLDLTPDLTTVTERGIRDQIAANNPTLDVNANKGLIKQTIKEVFVKVVEERSKAAALGRQASANRQRDRANSGEGENVDDNGSSCDSELEHATNREREGRRKKKKRVDSSSLSTGAGKRLIKRRRKDSGVKREPNPNNPFNAPLTLSEPLAAFVGVRELSRPQIVKAIWAYIKKNDLQDKEDKRYIVCDAGLSALFNTSRVHMFTMNKLIGQHILKDDRREERIAPPPLPSGSTT